jgi:hypothetical protein
MRKIDPLQTSASGHRGRSIDIGQLRRPTPPERALVQMSNSRVTHALAIDCQTGNAAADV